MFHMKQEKINIKLFNELRKKPSHQRELARKLDTNQTQIRRKLIDLENQNIVDSSVEGKNTIYSIKDSVESEVYEKIIENKKLLLFLEKPKIRKIFKGIQKYVKEGKIKTDRIIVLFGSYIKDEETKNSDIDIYINSDSKKEKDLIQELSDRIELKSGKFDKNQPLEKEIIKNHVVLNNIEGFLNLIK
mgnify:CR=1 FL=1